MKGTNVGLTSRSALSKQTGGEKYRANAGMRHIQFILVGLYKRDEFLEVFRRKVFPCDDQHWIRADLADRLKVDIWPVCEIRIERGSESMRPYMAQLDGVTIRMGAHRAGRPDGAAGANDIFDNDLLTESTRHVLAYDSGSEIERTASGERHDHCDRTRGKGLRLSDTRDGWQRGSAGCQMQKSSGAMARGQALDASLRHRPCMLAVRCGRRCRQNQISKHATIEPPIACRDRVHRRDKSPGQHPGAVARRRVDTAKGPAGRSARAWACVEFGCAWCRSSVDPRRPPDGFDGLEIQSQFFDRPHDLGAATELVTDGGMGADAAVAQADDLAVGVDLDP